MSNSLEKRKQISSIANEMMAGGLLKDAQKFIEDSILADPEDGRLYYQLGTCYDRQAKETYGVKRSALRELSVQAFMTASNTYTHDFYAANMAAKQLLKTGRPAIALSYALRANALRSDDMGTNLNIAKAYEALGRTKAALAYYAHVSDLSDSRGVYSRARIQALTA